MLVFELPLSSLEMQGVFKAACICFILNLPSEGHCISVTAAKYRDTSGGDLQTSGSSPVFTDVLSLLKPPICWELITSGFHV